MQALALQALVVAMMVAIGLELSPRDLVVRRRARFALAVLVNAVVLPLAVWSVGRSVGLDTAFLAGLVLCAAAPGGPTGPLFTRIAGANVGLATTLMVTLGVVGLVSAPAMVSLLLGAGGDGLFWPMFRTLALFQVLPLLVAMGVKWARPELAATLARPMGLLANLLLLGIIVGLLATKGALLWTVSPLVHLGLVAVLLAVMLPAAPSDGEVRGLVMVTAVRNLSVALLLSSSFFTDPQTDVAVLVWGFWIMVVPAVVAGWWGRAAP